MPELIIVLIAILFVGVWVGADSIQRSLQKRAHNKAIEKARWKVLTRGTDKGIEVVLECYGEKPQIVGLLDPKDPDFEQNLCDLEAKVAMRAETLNQLHRPSSSLRQLDR